MKANAPKRKIFDAVDLIGNNAPSSENGITDLKIGSIRSFSDHLFRLYAGKLAGLEEISAIVKMDLTDAEAYVYVIETNVLQRSFAELLPSEKAAVMAMRYEKVGCQGKRNDIIKELQIMNGIQPQVEEPGCGG